MCGIACVFSLTYPSLDARERALEMASLIRHRGPDGSGIYSAPGAVMAHERLSIVDVEGGSQPLVDVQTGSTVVANGEIYNHLELRSKLKQEHKWQTKSDCEVILYLYDEFGARKCVEMLSGIFAFALYDKQRGDYLVARDHLGIIPLYVGWDKQGTIHFASELKALDSFCEFVREFPPGHYYLGSEGKFTQWYWPKWATEVPSEKVSLTRLKSELEAAVKRQLMADVPYAVLISGGLDSSIIAAIAAKETKKSGKGKLHSFAIGLADSTDLKHARRVADYLGTEHHEIHYTVQEGIDALRDVIYQLETFDVTTIRASTPMYLMARKIKSHGIKMVLSGEGSDEVFGGYLYFHMAPNARELHEETVRKLMMLSKYDCLRANKSTAAWGLEARVPFLDKEFLDYAMSIDPTDKLCPGKAIEKRILREAFAGELPDDILWRQKEQFSDGVGYSWIDSLKKLAGEQVSDEMLADAGARFPVQTPASKEEYFYRSIFDSLFKCPDSARTVPIGPTIACSTPTAFRWSKEFEKQNDPSGRAVASVHAGGKTLAAPQ